jgi:glucokinase
LEAELNGYVQVENDANAAAMGEYLFGAGKGARSMVCLTLGTGVGGGIILEGKLWRGTTYVAGEIGHMIIEREGPLCGCGNRGCLEALASATGLIARVQSRAEKEKASFELRELVEKGVDITPKLLYQEAQKGDVFCKSILAETGTYLGIGLTNVIHVLNPEVIVLSGGLIGAGSFLLEAALAEVQRRVFPWAAQGTRILVGKLGDDAGVLGAAALVL